MMSRRFEYNFEDENILFRKIDVIEDAITIYTKGKCDEFENIMRESRDPNKNIYVIKDTDPKHEGTYHGDYEVEQETYHYHYGQADPEKVKTAKRAILAEAVPEITTNIFNHFLDQVLQHDKENKCITKAHVETAKAQFSDFKQGKDFINKKEDKEEKKKGFSLWGRATQDNKDTDIYEYIKDRVNDKRKSYGFSRKEFQKDAKIKAARWLEANQRYGKDLPTIKGYKDFEKAFEGRLGRVAKVIMQRPNTAYKREQPELEKYTPMRRSM